MDTFSDIKNRRVLVRGNIDVPLVRGQETGNSEQSVVIEDDTRLENIWPTIDLLLKNQNTVILCGHLGRPHGVFDEKLSALPVAQWFAARIENGELRIENATWVDGRFRGFEINKNFVVLENLRFFPEEENNEDNFAKELASLAEVFIDESFAESHKKVASNTAVKKFLPSFFGLRYQKEVEVLAALTKSPKRPMVVIVGGAKIETKLPFINKMAQIADTVIVGGKLLNEYKELDIKYKNKIILLELNPNGYDVTAESIHNTSYIIHNTETIIWNGPMGFVEDSRYQNGTLQMAKMILENKKAFKVVGGGDTVAFLKSQNLLSGFDFVSSAGGAMINFLTNSFEN